jgi:hypothetical protein
LITKLLNVLEEVKMSHMDQVLGIFTALMDAAATRNTSSPSSSSSSSSSLLQLLFQHIFSPVSGILEAVTYYKDHHSLHQYAFLLVEYTISYSKTSPALCEYLQHQDNQKELAPICEWLINYLDPKGQVISTTTTSQLQQENEKEEEEEQQQQHKDMTEQEQEEMKSLLKEIKDLFIAAEKAFGFKIFTSPPLLPSEDPVTPSPNEKKNNKSSKMLKIDLELHLIGTGTTLVENNNKVQQQNEEDNNNNDRISPEDISLLDLDDVYDGGSTSFSKNFQLELDNHHHQEEDDVPIL